MLGQRSPPGERVSSGPWVPRSRGGGDLLRRARPPPVRRGFALRIVSGGTGRTSGVPVFRRRGGVGRGCCRPPMASRMRRPWPARRMACGGRWRGGWSGRRSCAPRARRAALRRPSGCCTRSPARSVSGVGRRAGWLGGRPACGGDRPHADPRPGGGEGPVPPGFRPDPARGAGGVCTRGGDTAAVVAEHGLGRQAGARDKGAVALDGSRCRRAARLAPARGWRMPRGRGGAGRSGDGDGRRATPVPGRARRGRGGRELLAQDIQTALGRRRAAAAARQKRSIGGCPPRILEAAPPLRTRSASGTART